MCSHLGDQGLKRRHTVTTETVSGSQHSAWFAVAKIGRNPVSTSEFVRGHGLMEKQVIQSPTRYPVLWLKSLACAHSHTPGGRANLPLFTC